MNNLLEQIIRINHNFEIMQRDAKNRKKQMKASKGEKQIREKTTVIIKHHVGAILKLLQLCV